MEDWNKRSPCLSLHGHLRVLHLDMISSKAMRARILICLLAFVGFASSLFAQSNLKFPPTWYVSNTEPGEWIAFRDIYFTKGNYRFTGNLGATKPGARVQLVLNDSSTKKSAILGIVTIPKQAAEDHFSLIHLGSVKLESGNYSLALKFLDSNISADAIYVRKSSATGNSVLADDLANPAPSNQGKTKVAPIGPVSTPSKFFKYLDYNEEQCRAWYRQTSHYLLDRDDSIRTSIDSAVTSRLDWMWLHGRAAKTKPGWDWGIDREVIPNLGRLPAYRLERYFELLESTPYTEHMRYSYFCDNVAFGNFFSKNNGHKEARWGDPEFQEYIWLNWIRPWYETVPIDRHKKINGKVLLYFWTAECKVKGADQVSDFLIYIKKQLKKDFDLDVAFVIGKAFAKKDPRVKKLTYAYPSWFYWNMEENVTFNKFESKVVAFCTNGRRHPISSIWKTDWDPKTNTGTRQSDKHPADGYYRPAHTNGKSDYEEGLIEANKRKAKWMLLESWGNTFEGSTWFRSDSPDYKYPSEFIYITRKYADTESASLLLQAECYDAYKDNSPGNDGKGYRYNWTIDKEPDIDLYRPLHRIKKVTRSEFKHKVYDIAAGKHDVWVLNKNGKPFANEVDGNEPWKAARGGSSPFERLALGNGGGWALSNGQLFWTWFPEGWPYHNSGDWKEVENKTHFSEIAASQYRNTVMAIDNKGGLWRKEVKAKGTDPLIKVEGRPLKHIALGTRFLWGVTDDYQLVRRDIDMKEPWTYFKIEPKIRNISAGTGEVWIVAYNGDLYRMPEHGGDFLEYVTTNIKDVSLGDGFVWLMKKDGTLGFSRLEGFVSKKMDKAIPLTSASSF